MPSDLLLLLNLIDTELVAIRSGWTNRLGDMTEADIGKLLALAESRATHCRAFLRGHLGGCFCANCQAAASEVRAWAAAWGLDG